MRNGLVIVNAVYTCMIRMFVPILFLLALPVEASKDFSFIQTQIYFDKHLCDGVLESIDGMLVKNTLRSEQVVAAFSMGFDCIKDGTLGEEVDPFVTRFSRKYPSNADLMFEISQGYQSIDHSAQYINGKLKRWHGRGYNNREQLEIDREFSILFAERGLEIAKQLNSKRLLLASLNRLEEAILFARQDYQRLKLERLTIIDGEADLQYMQFQHPNDGNEERMLSLISNLKVPNSYESSKSDMQKWRWVKHQLAHLKDGSRRHRLELSDFIFDALADHLFAYSDDASNEDKERLNALLKNEVLVDTSEKTVFRLNSEVNVLAMYQELVEYDSQDEIAFYAMYKLSSIYFSRYRLVKSVEYIEKAIELYEKREGELGNNVILEKYKHLLELRKQLTSNIGGLVVDDSGIDKNLKFQYRNGSAVEFTLFSVDELHVGKLIKNKLADTSFVNRYWNTDDVLESIIANPIEGLPGSVLKKWKVDLLPNKDPFALNEVDVDVSQKHERYLIVEARLEGGNLSRYLVDKPKRKIVKTESDEHLYLHLLDKDNHEVSNEVLTFFGFYCIKRDCKKKSFTKRTKNGAVLLRKNDFNDDYSWVVVEEGGAYLKLSSLGRGVEDRAEELLDSSSAFIVSDQPVYRPGQTVNVNGWFRYLKEKPGIFEKLFIDHTVVVRSPTDEVIFEDQVKLDNFGSFDFEFVLGNEAALGEYEIELDDYYVGSHVFLVEEFKVPEFKVDVRTIESDSDDHILIEVSADYFYGEPVKNAHVEIALNLDADDSPLLPDDDWAWFYGNEYLWKDYDAPWLPSWKQWGSNIEYWYPLTGYMGTIYDEEFEEYGDLYDESFSVYENKHKAILALDSHGKAIWEIKLPSKSSRPRKLDAYGNVKVRDLSRKTIEKDFDLSIGLQEVSLVTRSSPSFTEIGKPINLYCGAHSHGKYLPFTDATINVYKIINNDGQYTESHQASYTLNTEEPMIGSVEFVPADFGRYRFDCELDKNGQTTRSGSVFHVINSQEEIEEMNDLQLPVNRPQIYSHMPIYESGDLARILVLFPIESGAVSIGMISDSSEEQKVKIISFENYHATEEFEVPRGSTTLRFFVDILGHYSYGANFRDVKVLPKESVLDVSIKKDKQQFQPGDEVELTLIVKDLNGKPFKGDFAMAVYDQAIEELFGRGLDFDIRQFFWMREELSTPDVEVSSENESFYPGVGSKDYLKQSVWLGLEWAEEEEVVVTGFRRSLLSSIDAKRNSATIVSALHAEDIGGLPDQAIADALARLPGSQLPNSVISRSGVHLRSKFMDSILWQQRIRTNKNGVAKVALNVPDNLTTWKVVTWGMGKKLEVGQASALIPVRKPLLLKPQVPRFANEKDQFVASAVISNTTGHDQEVTLGITIDASILRLAGDSSKVVNIKNGGQLRVDWPIEVRKPGDAEIQITASSNEFSDGVLLNLPVYSTVIKKKQGFSGVMFGRQDKEIIDLNIPTGLRKSALDLKLNLTANPLDGAISALPFLVEYPYGCTEQTLNRFLPALTVHDFLKKEGLSSKDFRNAFYQKHGSDSVKVNPLFDTKKINKLVEVGVKKLIDFQMNDGGWPWFSGDGATSSDYISALVYLGLLDSVDAGKVIEASVLERAEVYLNAAMVQRFKNKKIDNTDVLIALALARSFSHKVVGPRPEIDSYIDRLFAHQKELSLYSRVLLGQALAYYAGVNKKYLGKLEDQLDVIAQFEEVNDKTKTLHLDQKNNYFWWRWYNDEIELQAAYLKLLILHDYSSDKAKMLVHYLMKNRKNASYWKSTRDTAAVINALVLYQSRVLDESRNLEGKSMIDLGVSLGSREVASLNVEVGSLLSQSEDIFVEGLLVESEEPKITLSKVEKSDIYYSGYTEHEINAQDLSGSVGDIKIKRSYYRSCEDPLPNLHRCNIPLGDNEIVSIGETIRVELEIDVDQHYEFMLIEDKKLTGLDSVEAESGYVFQSVSAYREFRNDRVSYFVESLPKGKHILHYEVRAQTLGEFIAKPAVIEAMYSPSIQAHSSALKIVVDE